MATNIAPLPLLLQLRGLCLELLRDRSRLRAFRNAALPISTRRPSTCATNSAAGGRFKILDLRRLDAALSGAGYNRGGERMFAIRFDGGGSHSSSCSENGAAGITFVRRGLPSVSVPVLSTTSVSDLFHSLNGGGVFDENAGLRAAANADHDRHWCGESERARTGNDQHGDRIHNRVGVARLRSEPDPRNES